MDEIEKVTLPIQQNPVALTPEYIESYKFDRWVSFYTDDKNPETYSNGVKSVLAAYNANMSYRSACNIASDNMKKFKHMRGVFAEKNGFTFEKFQRATIKKFLESGKPEWFEKVAMVTGMNQMMDEVQKGNGVSIKTEDKDGKVTEIKIVSFEKPADDSNNPTV